MLLYTSVVDTTVKCDVCGCSSMVEFQPSKLAAWVRFPSPAPLFTPEKAYGMRL